MREEIQIFRYSDIQIYRYSDIRIFIYSDIQILLLDKTKRSSLPLALLSSSLSCQHSQCSLVFGNASVLWFLGMLLFPWILGMLLFPYFWECSCSLVWGILLFPVFGYAAIPLVLGMLLFPGFWECSCSLFLGMLLFPWLWECCCSLFLGINHCSLSSAGAGGIQELGDVRLRQLQRSQLFNPIKLIPPQILCTAPPSRMCCEDVR